MTVVAIVAALARVAPAAVGRGLVGALVSLGCFAVARGMVKSYNHDQSRLSALSLAFIGVPAIGFGIMFAFGSLVGLG